MPAPQSARDRIAFLRGLRAVRQFRPDPVPQQVVDDILEVPAGPAARAIASRGNWW